MKVKAINSFIGRVSMNIGDEREIIDKELAKDLIRAGYVVEIKATKQEAVNKPALAEKKVAKNNKKKK